MSVKDVGPDCVRVECSSYRLLYCRIMCMTCITVWAQHEAAEARVPAGLGAPLHHQPLHWLRQLRPQSPRLAQPPTSLLHR